MKTNTINSVLVANQHLNLIVAHNQKLVWHENTMIAKSIGNILAIDLVLTNFNTPEVKSRVSFWHRWESKIYSNPASIPVPFR